MPHFRFEPAKDFENFAQKMKKFIDEFPETFSFELGRGFEPRVDVLHDEQRVYVYVELAGVKKEDLAISYKDDAVTISGTRVPAYNPEQVVPTRVERAFGSFTRKVALPCDVKADSVQARFNDGVLLVTFDKVKAAAPDEIKIDIQ